MENFQKIKLEGNEYFIVDSIQNLRAEDSFIHRQNKLTLYKGNGESRKYVGSYTGENGKGLSDFFEFDNWGEERNYQTISKNCFFSKLNFVKYLYDARIEYQKQEQVYQHDISKNFDESFKKVDALTKELIPFSLYDVSDLQENKKGNRAYIRSDDEIWKVWRKLILPKISYLSILKLVSVSDAKAEPYFYFRILLDYQFRSIVHSQLAETVVDRKENTMIPKSREGATEYRKKVIEHMPQCPFTKISDERLLIASHIKPYRVCMNEGKGDEAVDYLNGLALSPTYDKLFDQGYITFTDKGELICGTQLSPYTWERLNINPNAKNMMRIYPENRNTYMQYHRKYVFQDDVGSLS